MLINYFFPSPQYSVKEVMWHSFQKLWILLIQRTQFIIKMLVDLCGQLVAPVDIRVTYGVAWPYLPNCAFKVAYGFPQSTEYFTMYVELHSLLIK